MEMEHNVAVDAVPQPQQPHEGATTQPVISHHTSTEDATTLPAVVAPSVHHPHEATTTNEPTSQNTSSDALTLEISALELQTPAKTSRLINVANVLDPAISNNPVLSAAIQVLDQISEVGKVLPFVAPAFVLLKIIIDLEKRATEVDVKCSDLLERITFMVSHVPLLKDVPQTTSIVQIVDRMNEAMKDSVALIIAYRKQGSVARRLRLSNREKFTMCVDAVNKCSNDLLIGLQIHQTVQLNILTRAVPRDVVVENYVSANGGDVEAVVHNRELVADHDELRRCRRSADNDDNDIMLPGSSGDGVADPRFDTTSVPLSSVASVRHPTDSNRAYFFCGNRYVVINVNPGTTRDTIAWGPKDIVNNWPSLRKAGFSGGVDAVLPHPRNGKEMYFFSGGNYALINIAPGTTDDYILNGPKRILDEWPSLREAGFAKIDAVLPNPANIDEAYFFSGSQYALINIRPGTNDDYIVNGPKPILDNWPSLKKAGFSHVDSILPNPASKDEAYFFSGSQYARINIRPGSTDDYIVNGPKLVRTEWPSLKQSAFW